jgi:hypothetical protein
MDGNDKRSSLQQRKMNYDPKIFYADRQQSWNDKTIRIIIGVIAI